MNCPDCGHDNISGVDLCEQCGASLTALQAPVSAVERSITRHAIGEIATKHPLSVPAFASVRAVIRQMAEARIGCVLVEEEGSAIGIFTERDILNRILPDRSTLDDPVTAHMTPSPETVSEDDSIAYALHLMSVGGYRHLPVANAAGQAAAIVSARDILRFLAIRFAAIRQAN